MPRGGALPGHPPIRGSLPPFVGGRSPRYAALRALEDARSDAPTYGPTRPGARGRSTADGLWLAGSHRERRAVDDDRAIAERVRERHLEAVLAIVVTAARVVDGDVEPDLLVVLFYLRGGVLVARLDPQLDLERVRVPLHDVHNPVLPT